MEDTWVITFKDDSKVIKICTCDCDEVEVLVDARLMSQRLTKENNRAISFEVAKLQDWVKDNLLIR